MRIGSLLSTVWVDAKNYCEVALGVRQARSIPELIPKGSAALVTPEQGDALLSITGTEGLVVEYGECCGPIPGDPIHGMLRTGHGVVIHRSQCPHLLKAIQNKVKIMPVSWAENVTGEYRVNVKVEAMNQRGVLAMMALAVSDAKANIDDIGILDYTEQQAVVLLKLQVTDRKQLANVIRRLRRIKLVMRAEIYQDESSHCYYRVWFSWVYSGTRNKKSSESVKLTMITKHGGEYYSKPTLSNALRFSKKPEALVMKSAEEMAADLSMNIITHQHVVAVDSTAKLVKLDHQSLSYDSVVFATGASSIFPRQVQ